MKAGALVEVDVATWELVEIGLETGVGVGVNADFLPSTGCSSSTS